MPDMPPDAAESIFFAVAGSLLLIWLAGTWFAFSGFRRPAAGEDPDSPDGARGDEVSGTVLIRGDPEALSRKLAEHIIAGAVTGSPARVVERTPERVAFERMAPGERGGVARGSGRVTLRREGDRIRADYALDLGRTRALFRAIAFLVCFVYGGAIIAGVPIAIWTLVLPSDVPAVRWQVLQTLQMVHGAWPPFLVGGIWRGLRRQAAARMESVLSSLEHVA